MTQTKRRPQPPRDASRVLKTDHRSQAADFISSMHNSGWRSINAWEDGGHTFEMLGRAGKTVLIQIYPEGHGFQVWRPVCESNSVDETRMAVEEYGGIPENLACADCGSTGHETGSDTCPGPGEQDRLVDTNAQPAPVHSIDPEIDAAAQHALRKIRRDKEAQ